MPEMEVQTTTNPTRQNRKKRATKRRRERCLSLRERKRRGEKTARVKKKGQMRKKTEHEMRPLQRRVERVDVRDDAVRRSGICRPWRKSCHTSGSLLAPGDEMTNPRQESGTIRRNSDANTDMIGIISKHRAISSGTASCPFERWDRGKDSMSAFLFALGSGMQASGKWRCQPPWKGEMRSAMQVRDAPCRGTPQARAGSRPDFPQQMECREMCKAEGIFIHPFGRLGALKCLDGSGSWLRLC